MYFHFKHQLEKLYSGERKNAYSGSAIARFTNSLCFYNFLKISLKLISKSTYVNEKRSLFTYQRTLPAISYLYMTV